MGSDMKKRPRDPAQLAKFVVDVATGEIEDTPGKAPKGSLKNLMILKLFPLKAHPLTTG